MSYTNGLDDPSAYFHTQLYTGTGSTNAITNDGNSDLQPDFIWLKDRSTTNGHAVQDTSRGITNVLFTNGTDYENQYTNTVVDSVQSDGFTVSTNANSNTNTNNYVAWQWKANGGTTSSNTDGDITSTVQVNTTAGFSIVTYTGNGSTGATIGHGLGVVPNWIIIKSRSIANDWTIYHSANTSAPETDFLILQGTDATSDSNTRWNDTAPTSTLITLGNNAGVNGSGSTYVGYAFAEKQGYSKFGSYTGNGNADGPFIYTGFKPAWVMFKKTSGADGWGIFDNKRGYQNATNPLDAYLQPNNSNAESAESDSIDFLSNGFKWRISSGFRNESGSTYIYMAFAEHPFVSSEGVPTTAR